MLVVEVYSMCVGIPLKLLQLLNFISFLSHSLA